MTIRFNENNEILKEENYRAIIAGLDQGMDTDHSMDELEGLAQADGVEVIGRMVQSLPRPQTATFLGTGKVNELAALCDAMEADTVIFNDELSGVQLRNLENALQVRVIDRTMLILDIFADRASSREGRLQVELAQLQYRLPRLTGFGKSLSRLGGGIGTRGPGEKKLEVDRRHIASRIDDIRTELRKISASRDVQRSARKRSGLPSVALMGYTNAGKSAIMNRILEASAKEEKTVDSRDMLFATLDPHHRMVCPPGGRGFLLIDTVGFVSRLPHSLIEAFRSTLEEVRDADLLIHVVDSAYEDRDFQMEVTEQVMDEICGEGIPRLIVYNKIDIAEDPPVAPPGRKHITLSAKTGENLGLLLERIDEMISGDMKFAAFMIPYDQGQINAQLCERGLVESIKYEAEGVLIQGRFSLEERQRYRKYAYGTV